MPRRPTDPAPVLVRRFVQLFVGLFLYGIGIALIVRGELGVAPWDVLTQGIAKQTGLGFGLITVITSGIVLLLWIPIRQKPGFGTVMNALLVGPAADVGLWLIPPGLDLWVRILLLAGRHRGARRRDRPLHRRALRPRPARRPDDGPAPGHRLADLDRAHRHRARRARDRLAARRQRRHRHRRVRAAHRPALRLHHPPLRDPPFRRGCPPTASAPVRSRPCAPARSRRSVPCRHRRRAVPPEPTP